MKPDRGHEPAVGLGRGRLLSRETVTSLGRAAVSRNPVTDWAKGRLLTMVISVLILVWGLGGIIDLTTAGPGMGTVLQGPGIEGAESGTGGGMESPGRVHARERMRNDLFKVAKHKKDIKKKEPKTNPVELLSLLELQGVLGGDSPRAIVFYKRTKETVTVSVGDGLGEFEVTEIRDRSVILKWREELFELSL